MLTTLIFTGIITGILFLIMSVGVIAGKTSLKGSCGASGSCDACGKNGEEECAREKNISPYRLLTRFLPFSRH